MSDGDDAAAKARGLAILEAFEERQQYGDRRSAQEYGAGVGMRTDSTSPRGKTENAHLIVGNFGHEFAEDLIDKRKLPRGLDDEVVLVDDTGKGDPKSYRADRVDWKNHVVYEVKPNNKEQRAQGKRQGKLYAKLLQREENALAKKQGRKPAKWRYEVVTYSKKRATAVLKKRGHKAGYLLPKDLTSDTKASRGTTARATDKPDPKSRGTGGSKPPESTGTTTTTSTPPPKPATDTASVTKAKGTTRGTTPKSAKAPAPSFKPKTFTFTPGKAGKPPKINVKIAASAALKALKALGLVGAVLGPLETLLGVTGKVARAMNGGISSEARKAMAAIDDQYPAPKTMIAEEFRPVDFDEHYREAKQFLDGGGWGDIVDGSTGAIHLVFRGIADSDDYIDTIEPLVATMNEYRRALDPVHPPLQDLARELSLLSQELETFAFDAMHFDLYGVVAPMLFEASQDILQTAKDMGSVASHISGRVHAYDASVDELSELVVEVGSNAADWREELRELEIAPPEGLELPE
jgi:hypothetical protein